MIPALYNRYYLLPNPAFEPNQPRSYESTLCRLAGWWSDPAGVSTLTPMELTLDTLLPVENFVPQSAIPRYREVH